MMNTIKTFLIQTWSKANIIIIIISFYLSLLLPLYCISSALCLTEQYKAASFSEDVTSFMFPGSCLSQQDQHLLMSKLHTSVAFQFWVNEIVPELTIDRDITIIGCGGNYLDFNSFNIIEGKMINENKESSEDMVCLISDNLSVSENLSLGDNIVLRGNALKIIGIIRGYGTEEIIVPYQLLVPIYGNRVLQQTITINADENSEESQMMMSSLKKILPSYIDIVTSNSKNTQEDNLHFLYAMLLSRIFVSIVVSVFSLLNIYVLMLGMMYRRKKQFAILRALGATRSDIFKLFLKENIINMTIAELLLLLSFQRLATFVGIGQEISWNEYTIVGITVVACMFCVVLSILLSRNLLKNSIYELLQGEN